MHPAASGARARRIIILLGVVGGLVFASSASAWTVTVKVHGAGAVSEVPNRFDETKNQGTCSVGPGGTSESSQTDCVLGSTSGFWNSGNVVRLSPSVPTAASNRGWQFQKWVDGTASGQINCDPQDTTGDQTSPSYCEFQIFQDLYVDLYFEDAFGPQDTSVSGGPASPTNQTSATFNFNAPSDPDSSYECRLDRPGQPAGSFVSCGNSTTDKSESYSSLTTNGAYTFYVRGKDPSGNVDPTPASHTWTVDTVPPNPSITGGPTGTTNATSASFGINTNEGTLTCNLDGAVTACTPGTTKTYPGPLGQGPHTFTLTAMDAAGNTATATRNWTVDTIAPTPSIEGGPSGPTNATSATFTLSTNEGTLTCKLDQPGAPGTFQACSAGARSYPGPLDDGNHTFHLRAIDEAGNTTIVTRAWTVDTEAPVLTLTGGPGEGSSTDQTSATFTIGTNEGTLTCTHDGSPEPCAPPTETLSGLAPGQHTFGISATDAAGNTSSESRNWTVVAPSAPPPPPPPSGPAADTTAPLLSYFKAAVHRIRNLRALGFLASCNEGCTLKAVAKLGRKTLGSKTVQLQAGYPTQVKIRISRTGLAALRAKLRTVRAVLVTIQFTLTDAAGNTAPAARKVKVRR